MKLSYKNCWSFQLYTSNNWFPTWSKSWKYYLTSKAFASIPKSNPQPYCSAIKASRLSYGATRKPNKHRDRHSGNAGIILVPWSGIWMAAVWRLPHRKARKRYWGWQSVKGCNLITWCKNLYDLRISPSTKLIWNCKRSKSDSYMYYYWSRNSCKQINKHQMLRGSSNSK